MGENVNGPWWRIKNSLAVKINSYPSRNRHFEIGRLITYGHLYYTQEVLNQNHATDLLHEMVNFKNQ